jgi:hypothetical protein
VQKTCFGSTDTTVVAQEKVAAQKTTARRWWDIPRQIAIFLIIAAVVGWALNRISVSLERSQQPAGLARGMLQGALMPMSMPNLLVGNDVTIYARNNTGLTYKLGYTLGVNVCGLFFFSFFFWRVRSWRRRR